MTRKHMFSILVLSGCLTLAGLSFAETCPDIQGDTGCAPSPYVGVEFTFTGVVYVVPNVYNPGSVYFQCEGGGGMTFYDVSATDITIGDEITVTGTVGTFEEQILLTNTSYIIRSSNNSYSAVEIGTADLSDGTPLMGSFMQATGLMTKESDFRYHIDDTSGPVLLYIDDTTGIDNEVLDLWLGDMVAVRGATKCYQGEGEIMPRSADDIELIAVADESWSWGSIKSTYR